ncbi:DNA-directed RNA polymerase I subunit RPA43 [Coniochaeta hoffmannii]|uniref:DNA-directed RNA polymerase subunit n=1 Tax=Coniochaeta hoffmannii TaxID=91930 RepID=A0AA38VQD0_9PEZI|nr:DNA-directed RNA polymerase I subunit RPA43 [Coniochaeta hoffmannii]
MPAVLLDQEPASINMDGVRSEKKHKRSKEHKKRPREEDENATPRRHKKSKKHRDEEAPPADEDDVAVKQDGSVNGDGKKRSKKHRKSKDFTNGEHIKPEPDADEAPSEEAPKKSKKKHRKHADAEAEAEDEAAPAAPQDGEQTPKKRKKDKSKKEERVEEDEEPAEEAQPKRKSKSKKKRKERDTEAAADEDAMDIDEGEPATTTQTSHPSSSAGFPFFTQTISLYVPFFPVGFDKPITNVASQHLDPLLNHYSPLLRGVLLGYRNVNLSERPVRPNPKNLPDDHTPALLESLNEYAVGFGFLTADVDLFIPSRGALMEGTVNLQSEGHIGVVCWNKFNASIEAKRLPAGWRWVDLNEHGGSNGTDGGSRAKGKHTYLTADPDMPSADEDGENEGTDILDDSPLELAELHTTGYWVDEAGERVSAKPLRFRIKNFDVGVAGDYGYISIEGTTLSDDEEREMGRQEREIERRRREKQSPGGLLRPMLRRVPEFSLTSFGKEEQEEDSIKKTVLYQGSRPGTPDD